MKLIQGGSYQFVKQKVYLRRVVIKQDTRIMRPKLYKTIALRKNKIPTLRKNCQRTSIP